jgi:hypothetical protein
VSARVFARLSLPLFLFLAAACGGGDDDGTVQPLAPPPVNPNLSVVGQGSIDLDIASNGTQGIDPTALLKAAGGTTPCGRLVFLFTYRVDGKGSIRVVQGSSTKIVEGNEAGASVNGCSQIAVQNLEGEALTGELRYVLAEGRQAN